MLLIVLMTACRSYDEPTAEDTKKEPSVLSVYVYYPERPVVTRASGAEVNPISNDADESAINNLQIWVFKHDDGALIAYHSTQGETSNLSIVEESGIVYQLKVSPEFEGAETKPNVDVYVLANNTVFDGSTTRDALDAAVLEDPDPNSENTALHGSYGLTTLVTKVPTGGLPMACVLHDASVTGTAPVFSVPTMKLERTVSKIRFIFSREEGETPVKINSIKLDADMIPTQEYLFLAAPENNEPQLPYNIGKTPAYIAEPKEFLTDTDPVKTDICQNDNPLAYGYVDGMDPQQFEDKIAEALRNDPDNDITPKVSQVGPFYLRESDKHLSGTIKYQAGEETEKTLTFSMSPSGEHEFSRNHTWTIYAYYGGSGLELVTVFVKDWENTETKHDVYNW